MRLFVKICGITDIEAAETAVTAGADAVGFVFADSPRQIGVDAAIDIAAKLPSSTLKVAVFRRPAITRIHQVVSEFRPDVVQADFDCLPETLDVAVLPVYRDGAPGSPDGGRFLYEGVRSGVGEQVDWQRAAGVARIGDMILAGGLRPDNVGRAITTVRPFGVDVSSGVESAPGVKSPALIRSFVAAVRAAEERLVEA